MSLRIFGEVKRFLVLNRVCCKRATACIGRLRNVSENRLHVDVSGGEASSQLKVMLNSGSMLSMLEENVYHSINIVVSFILVFGNKATAYTENE